MANMERVLDIYKGPYNASHPVICMDESPKQLIKETCPSTHVKPGRETLKKYLLQKRSATCIL